MQTLDSTRIALKIKALGKSYGFQQVGISDINLAEADTHLKRWLANGFAANLHYMSKHGSKRTHPAELVPGTVSIISVRMAYFYPTDEQKQQLANKTNAYIACYALGKDYHIVLKNKLKQYAEAITQLVGPFGCRTFTDSAPVMERAIAEKAGLGWIGKNTCLISKHEGSYFLLGEIFTDLELPSDIKATAHCGSCQACITACPTKAITAPYQLDARRCISYWTIEHKGEIPHWIRKAIGNRIFGCDDCQIVCPWNKYAKLPTEVTFLPRNQLNQLTLSQCFAWSKDTFLEKTLHSPIRRTGYQGFMRNVAIALGNAPLINFNYCNTKTAHTR